jgi:hypothetical protein
MITISGAGIAQIVAFLEFIGARYHLMKDITRGEFVSDFYNETPSTLAGTASSMGRPSCKGMSYG